MPESESRAKPLSTDISPNPRVRSTSTPRTAARIVPMRLARIVASLIAALVCVGMLRSNEPPAAVPPELPPNILVIVADTLRADRLHFAGHSAAQSPRLDALQRESVWFEHAYSTSSWTLPSTASLFTSQLVSEHLVSSWGSRLRPEHVTLVDSLSAAGYRTAMWTANRVIAGQRGFTERFDHSELVIHPRFRGGAPLTEAAFGSGQALAEGALAWLDADLIRKDPAPFFAYLQLMEPHAPYLCAPDAGASCQNRAYLLNSKILNFEWNLDAEDQALLDELYDAEVSRFDTALGTLLDGLDARGLLDSTWVVVVSDHGELLGEAGMYAHGRTLFDSTIHIPLIVRSPSGESGRIETPVSLIDLAPTILDLAGVVPPQSFRGESLRPGLEGHSLPERPIVSELLQVGAQPDPRQMHFVAIRDGNEKFVMRTDGRIDRFDLSADPDELYPRATDEDAFYALLGSAGARVDYATYAAPEFSEPTARMRQNLEALGYLH